jgi:AcrR family transcriptional regulator
MNIRKQNVLSAAHRLFVDKGFASTSIQDILDESGISKGTFYNYFSSKNECLMAIMEFVRDETFARRHEIAVGKDKGDSEVLIEQIAIRMQINKEHNMLALFESIFYANDSDLKSLMKKHHVLEIEWLANRLEDLFGKQFSPYVLDGSIMMMGMTQHLMQVQVFHTDEELNTKKLITFVLKRIETILRDVMQTGEQFLKRDTLVKIESSTHTDDKDELIKYIQQTVLEIGVDSENKGQQYIGFLLQELQEEDPRGYLIESVNRSIREVYETTPHRVLINELVNRVWRFIELR